MLWELDEFRPPAFLGFIRALPAPSEFQRQRWLPDRVIDDLEFEYQLGTYRRATMASVMGFDSEAPIHGRPGGGEKFRGELPPIKRKGRIGEKELARFASPRRGLPDQQTAVDSVYDLAADLRDAIEARLEWLAMRALSMPTLEYDEGEGVVWEFDFGYNPELQIDLVTQTDGSGASVAAAFGAPWTDLENSTPVTDLQRLARRVKRRTGQVLREFVCSDQVASLLYENKQIKDLSRSPSRTDAVMTEPELGALFTRYSLPNVVTYDALVEQEHPDGSKSVVRPMEVDRTFITVGGPQGNTFFGPTAESRILAGTALAGRAPGIWAGTYATDEPPAEWTKVAAVAFPAIPSADSIVQFRPVDAEDIPED